MGLLGALFTAPLAPVRGVLWVADRLAEAADRDMHDPDAIRASLAALNQALEAGEIGPAEFEKEEERLLDLLEGAAAAGGVAL